MMAAFAQGLEPSHSAMQLQLPESPWQRVSGSGASASTAASFQGQCSSGQWDESSAMRAGGDVWLRFGEPGTRGEGGAGMGEAAGAPLPLGESERGMLAEAAPLPLEDREPGAFASCTSEGEDGRTGAALALGERERSRF